MQITDILTKPITSQEKKKLIIFCLMSILWVVMIIGIGITAIKTENMKAFVILPGVLAIQFLMTNSYIECRVASLKKELLKEQEEIKFTLKAMEQAKNV